MAIGKVELAMPRENRVAMVPVELLKIPTVYVVIGTSYASQP